MLTNVSVNLVILMIYKCTICGHIHNEESTGVLLKNLDECPICKQPISKFVKMENSSSVENTGEEDSNLSYDKNYAKGNNYNESVKLTNEYFGLYFAVSGMKIRLMDKNDKKEEVKVSEVRLKQFSEIDFYRKKFKIIAEKRNMKYEDVLKLNLGEYEKIVDEIRQSNLDKIKGISDRLEPADKEMFEKIGLPLKCESIGVDSDILPMTFKSTKDIRDKYVLSRLAWDLGIIDELNISDF